MCSGHRLKNGRMLGICICCAHQSDDVRVLLAEPARGACSVWHCSRFEQVPMRLRGEG